LIGIDSGNHNFKTGLNFGLVKAIPGFGDKRNHFRSALGRRRLANDLGLWGWFWVQFLYGVDYKNWNNERFVKRNMKN
jgi:hypothetical protein